MLKRKLRRDSWESGEDVNPMESVANLADVMLVLAVGMMLALIAAWDVDMSPSGSLQPAQTVTPAGDDYSQVWSEDGDSITDLGLTEYGKVYRDADGNLYILEEEPSDGEDSR